MRPTILSLRYSLPAFIYMAIIFWLGSQPGFGLGRSDRWAQLLSNLFHVPLYAGLAFWVLRAVSAGEGLGRHSLPRALVTFLLAGGVAVLDEWRQALIPMRNASMGDLALDLLGITAFLTLCALTREPTPS